MKRHDNLRLALRFKADDAPRWGSAYFHPILDVVYLNEDGEIRNPLLHSAYDDNSIDAYGGLVLHAQGDTTGEQLYGITAQYQDVLSIDDVRARIMAKVLTTVGRRMAQLDEQYGWTTDYAWKAARFASALGIKATAPFAARTQLGDDGLGAWSWLTVNQLQSRVDGAFMEWRSKMQAVRS